jgi:hypothetical protein
MKHVVTLGTVVALALSLASCAEAPEKAATAGALSTSPPAQQELPTELLLSSGGKKAVVHSGPASAPREEAQLTGTLEKDGAGCLIIQAKDGDDYTLVFPEGTKFDGESLVLPDRSTLSEGDSVALDGARVPANLSLSMCLNHARLLSVEKASVTPS